MRGVVGVIQPSRLAGELNDAPVRIDTQVDLADAYAVRSRRGDDEER
jgi:hypothetical protein